MLFKKSIFYLCVTALIIYVQFFYQQSPISGKRMEITAKSINGESIADQINGGPGLIYFWAEWCGICTAMQKSVAKVFGDYPGISVAMQSGNSQQVLEYQRHNQLQWKTIADSDGSMSSRYGIKGVPTVFILDKKGRISFISVGYSTEMGLRLRLWLAGI